MYVQRVKDILTDEFFLERPKFFFLRKSKIRCWKIAQDYLSTLSNLEKKIETADNLIKEFACRIASRGVKTPPFRKTTPLLFWVIPHF